MLCIVFLFKFIIKICY